VLQARDLDTLEKEDDSIEGDVVVYNNQDLTFSMSVQTEGEEGREAAENLWKNVFVLNPTTGTLTVETDLDKVCLTLKLWV